MNFQKKQFVIIGSERVDAPDSMNNFRSQTQNYGFHYKLYLPNKKFVLLNNFSLFAEFKANMIQDGDVIQVDHIGRGKYKVIKLRKSNSINPGVSAENNMDW